MSLPTPYYQSDKATLYCGDCLEILPHLSGVDCVVTDPPYGIGFKYGEMYDDTREGYEDWCRNWFNLLPSDCALISVGQVNVSMWSSIKPFKWIVAWLKPAAMGRSPLGFGNWEPMLLYGKSNQTSVDVFTAPIIPSVDLDGHPCPKPLKWGEECVRRVSEENGTILDPFTGSGTTGVAAVKLGRRFIGIEIEPKYCEIAKRRIIEAEQQFALFDPPKRNEQLELCGVKP